MDHNELLPVAKHFTSFFKSEPGGTSWNLYDHSGLKVNEGIYLIFILSEDESEKLISKILIR